MFRDVIRIVWGQLSHEVWRLLVFLGLVGQVFRWRHNRGQSVVEAALTFFEIVPQLHRAMLEYAPLERYSELLDEAFYRLNLLFAVADADREVVDPFASSVKFLPGLVADRGLHCVPVVLCGQESAGDEVGEEGQCRDSRFGYRGCQGVR